MAVTGVTNTNTTNVFTDQINNPSSEMGKLDFLEMLITKLKYQDPTNPVKDESFVADMAQFSSLEQMTNLQRSRNRLVP
jgi:flagellar basal-body rod modification protein FlgD